MDRFEGDFRDKLMCKFDVGHVLSRNLVHHMLQERARQANAVHVNTVVAFIFRQPFFERCQDVHCLPVRCSCLDLVDDATTEVPDDVACLFRRQDEDCLVLLATLRSHIIVVWRQERVDVDVHIVKERIRAIMFSEQLVR